MRDLCGIKSVVDSGSHTRATMMLVVTPPRDGSGADANVTREPSLPCSVSSGPPDAVLPELALPVTVCPDDGCPHAVGAPLDDGASEPLPADGGGDPLVESPLPLTGVVGTPAPAPFPA